MFNFLEIENRNRNRNDFLAPAHFVGCVFFLFFFIRTEASKPFIRSRQMAITLKINRPFAGPRPYFLRYFRITAITGLC